MDLARRIAKALNANLSQNRRCAEDPRHVGCIGDLFVHAKEALSAILDRCQRLETWNGGRPDLCIVKNHWERLSVDAYLHVF